MAAGHRTPRIIAAVLTIAALTVPAIALASGGNRVKIKTPHKAKIGKNFKYTARGESSSARNHLATFINTNVKCKKTFKAEAAYNPVPPLGDEVILRLRKGHFGGKNYRFIVTPSSTGRHYICAYIYSAKGKTLAKASSNYTTH